jgi:hypothetical protein
MQCAGRGRFKQDMAKPRGLVQVQPQIAAPRVTRAGSQQVAARTQFAVEEVLRQHPFLRADWLVQEGLPSFLHLRDFARDGGKQRATLQRITVVSNATALEQRHGIGGNRADCRRGYSPVPAQSPVCPGNGWEQSCPSEAHASAGRQWSPAENLFRWKPTTPPKSLQHSRALGGQRACPEHRGQNHRPSRLGRTATCPFRRRQTICPEAEVKAEQQESESRFQLKGRLGAGGPTKRAWLAFAGDLDGDFSFGRERQFPLVR